LIAVFEKEGNANIKAVCDDNIAVFLLPNGTLTQKILRRKFYYNTLNLLSRKRSELVSGFRNGVTNDEIVNGVSERGGFTVVAKKMTQWSMRISAYAERLLQGLNDID
jgi:leucyl-tRNA synthetase